MILNGHAVRARMRAPYPWKLVMTPILDGAVQIRDFEAAIDVRLGQEFILLNKAAIPSINPASEDPAVTRARMFHHFVPLGEKFILHPQQFALASTLEYFRLPPDLTASIVGRSSWARYGLVVEMASVVHPLYAGSIVLELHNLGDVPLELYPGFRIAQVSFAEVTLTAEDRAAFAAGVLATASLSTALGPEYRLIAHDNELAAIRRLQHR